MRTRTQMLTSAGVIVLLLICLIVGFGSFYVTGPSERTVVTRTGQIQGVSEPGLHFKLPIVDSTYDFNMRADSVEVKNAEGGTHDQQPVHVDMTVRYQIQPSQVRLIFEQYSKHGNMDPIVATATAEAFKAITAHYTAPELLTKRQEFTSRTVSMLQEKLTRYGLVVLSIDTTQFKFESAYMAAVSEKVKQEQLVLTQRQILEKVEVEQQQKVKQAQAEADALKLRADAEAYQTERNAAARAKAIEVEAKALRDNQQLLALRSIEVDMRKAEKWNGALPVQMFGSAPIPFMPVK